MLGPFRADVGQVSKLAGARSLAAVSVANCILLTSDLGPGGRGTAPTSSCCRTLPTLIAAFRAHLYHRIWQLL